MCNLEGQDGVEVAHLLRAVLGDDAGGVEQALGDDDGVADGNRFQRLREKGTAADGAREGDVVVGEDIACERFECLVELAWGIEESGLKFQVGATMKDAADLVVAAAKGVK